MLQKNPFRYRGYYCDEETEWYYLGARYYDPCIRRFISSDIIVALCENVGCNLFAYCNNNPISKIDASGSLAESLLLEWTGTMGWLVFIDGPLPIGDLVFVGGIAVIAVTTIVASTISYKGKIHHHYRIKEMWSVILMRRLLMRVRKVSM